jgi:hypothetical protein
MGSWSLLKNKNRKPKKIKIVGIIVCLYSKTKLSNNFITCKLLNEFYNTGSIIRPREENFPYNIYVI